MIVDPTAKIIGYAVTRLREFFTPSSAVPPTGGGTDQVWILAGAEVVPPPWIGTEDSSECTPYLWVRLVRKWRTTEFPNESVAAGCTVQQAITIEAGIARCHPLDADADEIEEIATIEWDDAWRIDRALCAAMTDAKRDGAAGETALGPGEPYGPAGMLIAWSQLAFAELQEAR